MSYKAPRAAGLYDSDAVSDETALLCEDPSLAIQSQAEEADINVIVRRFGITGEIPISQRSPFPLEVDFDEVLDYRTAMDAMLRARRSFESLPAEVRSRFASDPVRFADWAVDPENLPELRKLGLAPPAAVEPEKPA